MSRHGTTITLVASALVPLLLTPTGAAHADPTGSKSSFLLLDRCSNGQTYREVANGNGLWSPGHDLDSAATIVPVAYGAVTVTVTNASGTVVDSFVVPAVAKGDSGASPRATVTCTTYSTATYGVLTGTSTGTVTVLVTGPR